MTQRKIKILFIFLFIIFISVSGRLDWETDIGIDYNLIIFYLIISIIYAVQVVKEKKIIFFANNDKVKSIFVIFLIFLALITTIRDGLFSTYFPLVLLTFIIVFFFSQLLYKIPIKEALFLFLFVMFILMIINLYYHYVKTGNLTILPDIRSFKFRLLGIFGAGLAGALAGLSAIIPLIIYLFGGKRYIIFLALNIVLAWYIMLLADNRTSMIACLIIYFLIFLQYSKKNIKTKTVFVIIGLSIYFFVQFYLTSSTGGQDLEADTNYRELIWFFGIDQIFQQPILGYGKQNPFATSNIAIQAIGQSNLMDPHNAYLFYILRNGIIVSFLFFWFIYKYLLSVYKNKLTSKFVILFSIPIYWLIIGLTGGDYFGFFVNFGSVIFGISVFGILSHPDVQKPSRVK